MRAWTWLLLLALAIPVAPARACLWDDDTLEDERRGLPGMAALLADKYERHSAFYYEHRIAQSRNKLAANPKDGRAHDNLSVALDKLGRHEEAREALLAKDRLLPGEYTTHANLGTVCYHLGKLEEAVGHIERALAINKEAHFGREEYQLRIVKQMLAVHRDPREAEKGPLGEPFDGNHRGDLEEWRQRSGLKSDPIEAIAGMIRFSNPRAPDLWLVLAELLAMRGDLHFAVRALLRAQEAAHPQVKKVAQFRERLRSRITDQTDVANEVIAAERAEGVAWLRAYQAFEDDAIRRGAALDSEDDYAPFYRAWGHRDDVPLWRKIHGHIAPFARTEHGKLVFAIVWLILLRVLIGIRRRRAAAPLEKTLG